MGIAAVVTTANWEILSTGRNYLNEEDSEDSKICNSVVSHAEINAIHALGPDGGRLRGLALFTTVEPCPMCIGAVGMSRVTKLYIGSRDPYAGSACELSTNPYLSRKQIECTFLAGEYETRFAGIHYLAAKRMLRDRPGHKFFEAFNEAYPEVARKIESDIASGMINPERIGKEDLARFA